MVYKMEYLKLLSLFFSIGVFFVSFDLQASGQINCHTKKFRIQIDVDMDSNFKAAYKSWSINSKKDAQPAIQLFGEGSVEGTGVCSHNIYTFKNGPYVYEFLGSTACTEKVEPKNALGTLIVRNGDQTILNESCIK